MYVHIVAMATYILLTVGVKGDTGDAGDRGPRGFVGTVCLQNYIAYMCLTILGCLEQLIAIIIKHTKLRCWHAHVATGYLNIQFVIFTLIQLEWLT